MPRCTSWRPSADPHIPTHLPPGSCHQCWEPCRSQVEVKGERCSDCLDALAMHPSSQVRFLVADDPSTPLDVLTLLTTDSAAGVAQRARTMLAELGRDTVVAPESIELDLDEGW